MGDPEKELQKKSLDKFKKQFQMGDLEQKDIRRSMTMHGPIQEQQEQQEEKITDDFKSLDGNDPLMMIEDDPPEDPEYIGFDRKFAQKRKDDGERMKKVRQALSDYYENKDKGQADPECLKEIINACNDYSHLRFAIFKKERGSQRLKEVEGLKKQAQSELDEYMYNNMKEYGNLAVVEHNATFDEDKDDLSQLMPPGFVTYTIGYSKKRPFTSISIPFWVLNDKSGNIKELNRRIYEARQRQNSMPDPEDEEQEFLMQVAKAKQQIEEDNEDDQDEIKIEKQEEDGSVLDDHEEDEPILEEHINEKQDEEEIVNEEKENEIRRTLTRLELEEEEEKERNEVKRAQTRIEQDNLKKKQEEEKKKKEKDKKEKEKKDKEKKKQEEEKKKEAAKKKKQEEDKKKEEEKKKKEKEKKEKEKEKKEKEKKLTDRERDELEFQRQIKLAEKLSLQEKKKKDKEGKNATRLQEDAIKKDLEASQKRVDEAYQTAKADIQKNGGKVMQKGKENGDEDPGYILDAPDEVFKENYTYKSEKLFSGGDAVQPNTVIEHPQVDNCYMIAALAALAKSDPEYVKNKLVTNDENHPKTHAIVRLYDEKGQIQKIRVAKTKNKFDRPLWVELVEKAACVLLTRFGNAAGYRFEGVEKEWSTHAVADKSLSRFDNLQLGSEELVCRLLFGRKGMLLTTRDHDVYDKDGQANLLTHQKGDEAIGKALAYAEAGKLVIASTCERTTSAYYNLMSDSVNFPVELQPKHEYTFYGEGAPINGQRTVRLKDAKKGEPFDITFGDFKTCFTDIHISGNEER